MHIIPPMQEVEEEEEGCRTRFLFGVTAPLASQRAAYCRVAAVPVTCHHTVPPRHMMAPSKYLPFHWSPAPHALSPSRSRTQAWPPAALPLLVASAQGCCPALRRPRATIFRRPSKHVVMLPAIPVVRT